MSYFKAKIHQIRFRLGFPTDPSGGAYSVPPTSQGQHCLKMVKPPQTLIMQMAERLLRAQPNSVANHVTDRSISDRHALT